MAVTLSVLVIPLAVALLLCALLAPLVGWLTRHRVPRGLATAAVLVGGIAVITGVLTYVVQAFVRGLPELRGQVSDSLQTIGEYLDDPPFGLPPVDVDVVLDQLSTLVAANQGAVTSGALSTAASIGTFLASFVLAIFGLIIFLYQGASIWQFLVKVVPAGSRGRVADAGRDSFTAVGNYARATFLVAVIDAVGIGFGLLLVGALVGITGAVLAVPLLAALNASIRSLTHRDPPPPESDPADTAAVDAGDAPNPAQPRRPAARSPPSHDRGLTPSPTGWRTPKMGIAADGGPPLPPTR